MAQFTVLLLVFLPLTPLPEILKEELRLYYIWGWGWGCLPVIRCYIYAFSVDLDGVFQRQCISCNLIDGCRFFKADFSPNQTHFTLYCLGKSHPAFMPQNNIYILLFRQISTSLKKKTQVLESLKWPSTTQRTPPVSVSAACLADGIISHTR